MTTVPNGQTDRVVGVDEEFLALMCADEELLRAEFDAIIAEEWADSPPRAEPPVASPSTGPGPRRHGLPRGRLSSRRRTRDPADDGWGRQRSPPRFSPAHDQESKSVDGRRR